VPEMAPALVTLLSSLQPKRSEKTSIKVQHKLVILNTGRISIRLPPFSELLIWQPFFVRRTLSPLSILWIVSIPLWFFNSVEKPPQVWIDLSVGHCEGTGHSESFPKTGLALKLQAGMDFPGTHMQLLFTRNHDASGRQRYWFFWVSFLIGSESLRPAKA